MEKNYNQNKFALVLRGHIRDSFDNDHLKNFVEKLAKNYSVDVYVQSWVENEAKVSWGKRKLRRDNIISVNEEYFEKYFGSTLMSKIKKFLIYDDSHIKLIGDVIGSVQSIPKIAWKNMWYGKYNILKYVKETNINYDFIVNMRIDLFTNQISIQQGMNSKKIIKKIDNLLYSKKVSNLHFFDRWIPRRGIDNCYFGPLEKMYEHHKLFHYSLDEIDDRYNGMYNHEKIVFFVAKEIYPSGFWFIRKAEEITPFICTVHSWLNTKYGIVAWRKRVR
ncbi:MAG: hypothetical protein QF515_15395 [Pseudomonadales bacterium]|jgi:hypothetical protein|nr:hypothetical protein [Pseudomonadales bacterium]|tara:strand:- start:742 stop:1569 length:828 start_codon:yes stop_codon:yes gene_type:complete